MHKKLMILAIVFIITCTGFSNPWNGKVVLQGFWWDYWNNNYPNEWATYLAVLAPRLSEIGIDAVWVPPAVKNNSPGSVGYSPFDHYDLGDKYQKGSTETRLGTKDEYLRLIAVLHANGMDVIQDVVWNHLANAGSADGSGGKDYDAWSDKWKNFRYVSYQTPAGAEDSTDYFQRSGRFPKNWQNFHPNSDHNQENDDWTQGWWGPDICYYQNAIGLSSNCTYNPVQSTDYMRNGMRTWNIWMKKQTGVDGYRIDASKHFPYWVTKDFLWNLAYNAGWAGGGSEMFAVGEYVGSKSELDTWVSDVNNSDGFTDVVGTFDFSIRQSLRDMVYSLGSYDLSQIPGQQQSSRTRTVPFVNNHDTFRPILAGDGTYDSWDTANELGGGHIDPTEPRIEAAYAIAMAVDGSPQVFFEDLFDIGESGLRWSHDPSNIAELQMRDFLVNLIWCHQKLNFKDGSYKVKTAEGGVQFWDSLFVSDPDGYADILVIERSGQAIIGVNDQYSDWKGATITTDFAQGTVLHDYSGANSGTITVPADQRITIWVPPCNGSNTRRGYCVWGPDGISGGFSPSERSTTQEWEMADDLGDSHASSLQQGGALPTNSTELRTVGRIWSKAAESVSFEIYPEDEAQSYTTELYSHTGVLLTSFTRTGISTFSYTPPSENWMDVKVRNTSAATAGQKVWVKITYTGPQSLNFSDSPLPVLLQSFTARFSDRQVILNWKTASEVELHSWQIERKTKTHPDPLIIAKIEAAGSASSGANYEFTDKEVPKDSNIFYRLADNSLNGAITYHPWLQVSEQLPQKIEISRVYPNPFNPNVSVLFNLPLNDSKTEVYICDLSGKKIITLENRVLPAGQHRVDWNGRNELNYPVAAGMYFIVIKSGSLQATQKTLLLK